MSKISGGMKFVWKNNKAWLLTTAITLVLLLVVTLVATQVVFLRNTISTVMGGERRYLIEGQPEKYEYYKADKNGFKYYEPTSSLPDTSIFSISNRDAKKAKDATLKEANLLNEKIVEEGVVLLKNTNKTLPLSTSKSAKLKVSVFGKNSVNLVYGGSGSGGGKTDGAATIYDSLSEANFEINPVLKKFYDKKSQSGQGRKRNPAMGEKTIGIATGETPQSSYPSSIKDSYKNYKDVAFVVFSRIGGEGFDLPQSMKNANGTPIEGTSEGAHYLQLDNNEKDLLDSVCSSGFSKVVVLINSSTSMELGFIEDNDKIDAAMWIGSPGFSGVMAVGRVLNGTASVSGRLIDTYARDFKKDPTWVNFSFQGNPGDKKTAAGNEYLDSAGKKTGEFFAEYAEGIYIGYRYYETKGFEMQDTDAEWYDKNVVYPFGYGLSYTNFEWNIVEEGSVVNGSNLVKDDKISVKVNVKNTGDFAGMDVVQLFYSAPFTDGIEKSYINLGAFAKTKLLKPDEQETVTLEFNVRDMASYDYNKKSNQLEPSKTGWKLEGGNYKLMIGENAHAAWTNTTRAADKASLNLSVRVPAPGFFYDKDSASENPIENRFDELSNYMAERGKTLTRTEFFTGIEDWAAQLTQPDEVKKVTSDFVKSLKYGGYSSDKDSDPWFVPESDKPTVNSKGESVKLYDMLSVKDGQLNTDMPVDYDDTRWNAILDRFTVEEMATLIGTGNFNTINIEWLGKPKTTDPDGPAGFTNFMGDPTVYDTCFYASECVIAATWNTNLVHDMGVMVGLEGIWGNQKGDGRPYSGWYAPAVNIHRSPFSGRNFEYYSEDGYLSGMLGASVVKGAKSKGVYTYVKHFALNDMETDRGGICTWADEQTMREIYLKPFEIIVKEGKTTAMMSSFNRIGSVWAGGDYRLLTEILRDEWGFKGMVISDYNTYAHMPADQMIRAGGDLNLIQDKRPTIKGEALTATQITAMRKATKNILYTVAGSNAMNGVGDGVVWGYKMPAWIWLLIGVDVGAAVIFACWGLLAIKKSYKKGKQPIKK